jgi:hypothetical protein
LASGGLLSWSLSETASAEAEQRGVRESRRGRYGFGRWQ